MAGSKKETVEYFAQFKDVRWQKKRLEILTEHALGDEWQCDNCLSGKEEGVSLHVHHGYYEQGKAPWEYGNDTLWVLCDQCHDDAHSLLHDIKLEVARTHPTSQGYLLGIINAFREARLCPSDAQEISDAIIHLLGKG